MFEYFLLLLAAYLIGSIPWSDWILKTCEFERPSDGSVGPWQVLYYGGPLTALLSLIGEGAKGAIVVFLAEREYIDGGTLFLLLGVVLGQQWSPWLKWRGTGGALALVGAFLSLFAPLAQGIITIYTAVLLLTRRRIWASWAVAMGLLPLVVFFHPGIHQLFIFAFLALLLIVEQKKPSKSRGDQEKSHCTLEGYSRLWSSTPEGGSQ